MDIAKILLSFYAILAIHNSPLLGNKMNELIDTNRIVQHVIGFILMLVIVNMVGGMTDTYDILFYGIITYLWFLFTTKLELQWNLAILLLLLVWFLYENRMNISQQIMIVKDKILNDVEKTKVIAENNKKKILVSIGLMILTFIGTGLYTKKKTVQYGGGKFDIVKFLLY